MLAAVWAPTKGTINVHRRPWTAAARARVDDLWHFTMPAGPTTTSPSGTAEVLKKAL